MGAVIWLLIWVEVVGQSVRLSEANAALVLCQTKKYLDLTNSEPEDENISNSLVNTR